MLTLTLTLTLTAYQAEEKQAKHKELLDVQALLASIYLPSTSPPSPLYLPSISPLPP